MFVTGPIWLDNFVCDSSDEIIEDCRYNEWGQHNCDHETDVSLMCFPSKNCTRMDSPLSCPLPCINSPTSIAM